MPTPLAIPAKARNIVYLVIGVVSLAVGAAQVGYAALGSDRPDWLVVALAVVPFVSAGVHYTSATHTPKVDATVEPYVGEHRAPLVVELGAEEAAARDANRPEGGPDVQPQGYVSGV